ncbi:MAG: rRNA maturation RNase YbeY [Candidatus Paceibacterota bacterium]
MQDFSIRNTTKSEPPISGALFCKMKDAVLGKKYDLSVAFVGEAKIRALNNMYRKKDYVTDILSFPISETSGEIIICEKKANQKAKLYDRKSQNFLYFLFIHGLVHLKGFDHGAIMEKEEEKFRKKFGI